MVGMVKSVSIGARRIGEGEPCFVIAEAGVNHNGDPALAHRLISAAKRAGADAVKFQTWITEKLVTPEARMAEYQVANTGRAESQFDMLKRLELSHEQFTELKAACDRESILFLSTPDEQDSADFLESLGVPLFKIGSGEVTNLPYLHYVACKGRPIILSTGMSTLDEVRVAVRALEAEGLREIVLLHCVSQYPASAADCNLRALDTLREAFGYPVGFSDHTMSPVISLAAVARGACVIEKHLTLDRNLPGPDHRASLEPDEFAAMVAGIRTVESALGDGIKRPTPAELETRRVVQRSIVAARDLPSGHRLELSDLSLLRASGGLPPSELETVAGRVLRCARKAGALIGPDDLL